MDGLDEKIERALKVDMVVDITTMGRKSGLPRRIEIWAHYLDGQVLIMGSPGPRSWYANLLENPDLTFHLKQDIRADIPAMAHPVTDEAERRAIFTRVKDSSGFDGRREVAVETRVSGSRLVTLAFRSA